MKGLETGKLKLYSLEESLPADLAAKVRLRFLEEKNKVSLKNVGLTVVTASAVRGKNVENFIGAAQIPLGVVGPLLVKGEHAKGEFYVPLATSEGALLATVNRGAGVISKSNGVKVRILKDAMTRAPVFRAQGIEHAQEMVSWVRENFEKIKKAAESTTTHGKLLDVKPFITGRNVYLRFSFDTKDAMGMNMATIACDAACGLIERETKSKCVSLSGNVCTDKKPAAINLIEGRGKTVVAEVVVSSEVVRKSLKSSVDGVVEINYRKNLQGSALAGALSYNSHVANMIAGVFAATGQDLAQVTDSSLAIASAEKLESGDLYFSLYLPALEVGTVGGGTGLPTQKECLELLGCAGSGKPPGANSKKLAEIIAATALAGELSTLAAQSAGHLAPAHKRLGR